MAVQTKPSEPVAIPRPRRSRGRKAMRWLGKGLITAGVILLLFVAWELWGTGIITNRYQSRFRDEIGRNGFPSYEPGAGRIIPGNAIGYIRIPRIKLDMVFVQGIGVDPLKRGPGHYPTTPLPGQKGNVAIAGHRTTYLHPFWSLDKVRPGDTILVDTHRGHFSYRVVKTVKDQTSNTKMTVPFAVPPTGVWVLAPTKRPSLTLTTCNPRFSAAQRLIVRAVQIGGPFPPGVFPPGVHPKASPSATPSPASSSG